MPPGVPSGQGDRNLRLIEVCTGGEPRQIEAHVLACCHSCPEVTGEEKRDWGVIRRRAT